MYATIGAALLKTAQPVRLSFPCSKSFVASPVSTFTFIQSSNLSRHQQQNCQQQIRHVHSNRQIKRIFLDHPARQRILKRESPEPPPPLTPTYPPLFTPELLPNGWSAPPGPEISIPEYPFRVTRTKSKPNGAVGFLPVYTKYRYVDLYYVLPVVFLC
jgi:hypothetical protein